MGQGSGADIVAHRRGQRAGSLLPPAIVLKSKLTAQIVVAMSPPCLYRRAAGNNSPNRVTRMSARPSISSVRPCLNRDPVFVYTNFEFIGDDGSVNEIDALVLTQAGVFLLELKSRGGIVTGNRHLWDWNKDGRIITVDSPLTLANAKARKLAGLLANQRAFRGDRAPWVEALSGRAAFILKVAEPLYRRQRNPHVISFGTSHFPCKVRSGWVRSHN